MDGEKSHTEQLAYVVIAATHGKSQVNLQASTVGSCYLFSFVLELGRLHFLYGSGGQQCFVLVKNGDS